MKRTLLVLAVGALLACPALADDDSSMNTPPPGPPPDGEGMHHHGGPGSLTKEEADELRAAHEAAFKANPDLAAEEKALREKIDAAMIAADPKVEPILAKLKAHHGGPGMDGPPPPPPSDSSSSSSQ